MSERKRVSLADELDDFSADLDELTEGAPKMKLASPPVRDPGWERPIQYSSAPAPERKLKRKSERTEQFNSRVKPALLNAFRARLEEQELTVVVGLERALKLYLQHTDSDQTDTN